MDSETVIWSLGGVNVALASAVVFLVNKTWDRSEKEQSSLDQDVEQVRIKTEKNEEHISKFRGELGLLNNEIINKIGHITLVQNRIEKDIEILRNEYRELDRFLRTHFVAQTRKE